MKLKIGKRENMIKKRWQVTILLDDIKDPLDELDKLNTKSEVKTDIDSICTAIEEDFFYKLVNFKVEEVIEEVKRKR